MGNKPTEAEEKAQLLAKIREKRSRMNKKDDDDAKSAITMDTYLPSTNMNTSMNPVTEEIKIDAEEKKEEEKEEAEDIFAERFDFTFMDYFYKHNIGIDEYGEILTTKTDELARIVTKEGLLLDD